MSDRITNFLIKLAEDADARAAFEAAPAVHVAAHGLTRKERAAVLSGDDTQIIDLEARRASDAPVAKILGGMDEESAETPVVAKILGGFDEDENLRRLAKSA